MLEIVIVGMILMGCQGFYRSSDGENNHYESEFSDITSLCCSPYSCGVASAIL